MRKSSSEYCLISWPANEIINLLEGRKNAAVIQTKVDFTAPDGPNQGQHFSLFNENEGFFNAA